MSALRQSVVEDHVAKRAERERRRHRRIQVKIAGRFLDEGGHEHAFSTFNISCSGAFILSAQRPAIGAEVVCYFDELGRVPANVVRRTSEGFAALFNVSPFKRNKLADRLIWIINRDPLGLQEERDTPRYAAGGPALVTRADGRQIQCRAIDISLTGAGFETDGPAPDIGEVVSVGNLRGEVVRRTPNGFGIRFLHADT